jgi:hypothetical protein
MVALVLSAGAALALGLTTWLPRLAERDIGVAEAEPRLLTVASGAQGRVVLGNGVTVELFRSGLRARDATGVLADTVTRGAPVTALLGAVEPDEEDGHPRERVTGELATARVDTLVTAEGEAVWSGSLAGEVDGRDRRLPLTLRATRAGGGVLLRAAVPGADALVWHLDARPAVTGIPPALPDRNLRLRAWWLATDAGADATFTWVLGSRVGLGPGGVARAVDLRPDGRIALHAWAPASTLAVQRLRPTAVGHSTP